MKELFIEDISVSTSKNHYEASVVLSGDFIPEGCSLYQSVRPCNSFKNKAAVNETNCAGTQAGLTISASAGLGSSEGARTSVSDDMRRAPCSESDGAVICSELHTGVLSSTVLMAANPAPVFFWSPEKPVLYNLVTVLFDKNDNVLDKKIVRFGFREFSAEKNGAFLNYKKINLKQINLEVPCARENLKEIKKENDINCINISFLPDENFLETCDELGLLVFLDSGDVRVMNHKYKNHPCFCGKTFFIQ